MSCPRSASIASQSVWKSQRRVSRFQWQSLCRNRRRWAQIRATPSADNGNINAADVEGARVPGTMGVDSPDARFEVLGSPYSVLSVSLSASQNLYTRRGTLVGVGGKAENVTSTLSLLEPLRRALLGIPFFYQKITSTSPLTALISTKSPITSFAVAHLDGTTDWMVAQRQALLAWTGDSLLVQPTMNHKLSLAHWGNTKVGGRGLIAVVGKGQVYQLGLKEGETYVAHPSNIVAYIITTHPPLPYRFKTNILSLDIPNLGISKLLPDTRFFNAMRDSDTWKNLKSALFAFRTWSRRTIWGDRLFLQFRGPMTILLQSRASRVADSLTARDVNEIVDSEPGAVNTAVTLIEKRLEPPKKEDGPVQSNDPTALKIASVGKEGKVSFEETNSFESLEKR